jgi:hypothetical protein
MALLSPGRRARALTAFALAGLALASAGAAHATDEDAQAWAVVNATGALNDKMVLAVDGQARFSDDASRLGQLIVRPSVGWRLDSTTTASLGYAYIRSTPNNRPTTHEHRGWQQMSYRLAGDGKGVTLTGRTRLEQRWVEGRDGTGWRVRQQLRVAAPLKDKVRGVAWTEPFVGLNQTTWGQRDGLHLWRSFAGVSVPISKTVTLEPGYLHQRAFRTGPDAVTHAAAVWVNLQF